MRFLIDECVWKGAGRALEQLGHDVAYVVLDSSGISDEAVLDRGEREDRVVITMDRRMTRLVMEGESVPRGIVVLQQADTCRTAELILPLLNQIPGQITIIDAEGEPRFRPITWARRSK